MAQVLVVDDDGPVRELVSLIVAEAGHAVRQASDGREALALAHEITPDLIISDVMMPVMSGMELLAALRADPALSNVPVVLISAGSVAPVITEPEMTIYIRKPFNLSLIEALLVRFLAPPGVALDRTQG